MTNTREVTFKGETLKLQGEHIQEGMEAPDFTALSRDLEEKGLKDFQGKVKLIAAVPSLDTPVCDLEIKRFNAEAARISDNVAIIFISMDLPFAQKRFCEEFDINKVELLSDHRSASFGLNYGVLIEELRLLARSIFIVDEDNKVRYAHLVKEITDQPDYAEVLKALEGIVKV